MKSSRKGVAPKVIGKPEDHSNKGKIFRKEGGEVPEDTDDTMKSGKKCGGKVPGKEHRAHGGRAARKSGGSVGSTGGSPFSAAHSGTMASGHTTHGPKT